MTATLRDFMTLAAWFIYKDYMSNVDHFNSSEPMYKTGDKFACWRCDARLFEITRNVFAGETMLPRHFNFVSGQKVTVGMKTECSLCGQAWFNNGVISAKKVLEQWQ
jgi:hypothetical protein